MTELVATLSPDRMIEALDEELHRLKAICSEIEHDLMSSPIRLRFSGQSATRKASRPSSIMVTITEVDDDQGIHERDDPTNNETSEMLVSTDLPIQEQSIQEPNDDDDDDDDDNDEYDGLFTIRLFDDDDDEVQMPQPQMIPALEVTIDCSICWATTPSFATLPCGHLFCKPCLDDLVRVASTNSFGEMPVVVCPQVDCGLKIEHSHQIRQITSPVTFLTYTYFQMRAEAKAYSGLHNCHNPALQCEGVLLPSDFSTDLKVSCRLCSTVHCSVCFLPDHPDLSCQEASRIQRKRAKTNSVEYQRRKQRRARLRGGIKAIIPTIITQTFMTVHPAAKRCPGCFNWIFKNGGCHHMNCQHCHINFCWDCRSPYGGRPHCLLNGILFPVALPIAVATCAVYSASAILPVSLYLVGHRIKKAIQGRPYSFPGQVVGDACLMNYHIGNYIAPFTYHQMFH